MKVLNTSTHFGRLYYTMGPFDNEVAYKNIDQDLIDKIVEAQWDSCIAGPEKLYYGRIPQYLLTCDPIHIRVFKDVDKALGDWIKNPKDTNWEWEKFWPGMSDTDESFNRFMKFLYLSNEIFKDGDFKNPIGVHYNPRLTINVIHPGGMRQAVLHLFGPANVKAFYFNTGGMHFEFTKYLKEVKIQDIRPEYGIHFTCDHGTFVPHVIKDVELIVPGIENIYPTFLETTQNINLEVEGKIDSPALSILQEVKGDIKCKLKIKSGYRPTFEEYIKIITYIILRQNFSGNNFNITFSESLI